MEPGEVQGGEAEERRKAKGGKKAARLALFVSEYLSDPRLNATQAAIRVGYAENSAAVTASRLMKDPWVKAQIKKEFKRRRKQLKSSADKVQYELEKIAFANFADYTKPDGSIDLLSITRDQAAAILEVKVTKVEIAGQEPEPPVKSDIPESDTPAVQKSVEPKAQVITTKFKLQPKTTALKLLGQMHGAFTEKVEHSGKVTVVVDL